jgi:hypothetical protein
LCSAVDPQQPSTNLRLATRHLLLKI